MLRKIVGAGIFLGALWFAFGRSGLLGEDGLASNGGGRNGRATQLTGSSGTYTLGR